MIKGSLLTASPSFIEIDLNVDGFGEMEGEHPFRIPKTKLIAHLINSHIAKLVLPLDTN